MFSFLTVAQRLICSVSQWVEEMQTNLKQNKSVTYEESLS